MPITGLAAGGVKRQEDFIGIHFFSPVDKMPLVEIIKGEKTSDEALARVFDYTLAIGKTPPIVVNDSRGFYTSRVIGTFVNEALAMLGEGVEPASIEHAGSQAGYPAPPPLQLSDELNLELMHKIALATRKRRGCRWHLRAAPGRGRSRENDRNRPSLTAFRCRLLRVRRRQADPAVAGGCARPSTRAPRPPRRCRT